MEKLFQIYSKGFLIGFKKKGVSQITAPKISKKNKEITEFR